MSSEYWYPWYPDAYEGDAGHLDHVADSCYRRLIDFYMRKREPIKKDPLRLMYITRTTPQQFQFVWPQIEGFFTLVDGYLHLKRCNTELDRQDRMRRNQSEAGKRSAQKRKQQIQILINDRSADDEPPFNGHTCIQDRTGQDKDINITTTVPIAAREGNGHANGHKNGLDKNLDINPLRASRAFQRKFTPDEKHEAWKQKMIRFMRVHWSADATREAIELSLSDNPDDRRRAQEIFDAADVDYKYRKAAGTLQPMDHV